MFTNVDSDFKIKRYIGKGAYGKVMKVEYEGKEYAMKIMRKKFLVEKDNVSYLKSEREILTKMNHPFVVKLYYAFQNDAKVFLVMDYHAGGELFFHLRKNGFFTEKVCQFYLAEILIALEHLHNNGIIHR